MKFSAANERNVLTLTGVENCDTDSWPIVGQISFRRYENTYDPELGAVAAAILFSAHCGSVAEFSGVKIGIDAARSIRRIAPEIQEVLPIDGARRDIPQGSRAVVVVEAAAGAGDIRSSAAGKSARVVTWSGDCVPRGKRNSTDYVCGEVFTNADLVARPTAISAALGLLVGGRNLHEIFVAPPARAESGDYARFAEGLSHLGLRLRTL